MNQMSTEREAKGKKHLHTARAAYKASGGIVDSGTHDDMAKERAAAASGRDKAYGGGKGERLPEQRDETSRPGFHSGRPHPPKHVLGGDEFDHASNGGTLDAQNAVRK
jgi:hypothetical protein